MYRNPLLLTCLWGSFGRKFQTFRSEPYVERKDGSGSRKLLSSMLLATLSKSVLQLVPKFIFYYWYGIISPLISASCKLFLIVSKLVIYSPRPLRLLLWWSTLDLRLLSRTKALLRLNRYSWSTVSSAKRSFYRITGSSYISLIKTERRPLY